MFIRFVTSEVHPDSQRRKGIFQALFELRDRGRLSEADCAWADAVVDWFDAHLERPSSFATSKRHNARARGVSWFRESAREHIAQARSMSALPEQHGLLVEEIRKDLPGYVLSEDEFQVVSDPFDEP